MADWSLEPWMVSGGFRVARVRWVLDRREDWDQEHEFVEWDCGRVYPTQEEALAAIVAHSASRMGSERSGDRDAAAGHAGFV